MKCSYRRLRSLCPSEFAVPKMKSLHTKRRPYMANAERSNNNRFHSKDDVVSVLRSMESTTSPITLGGMRLKTLTSDNAIIPIVYRFHSNLKNHDNFFIKYIFLSFHMSIYCTIVLFSFHIISSKKNNPSPTGKGLPIRLVFLLCLRIDPQEDNKRNDCKCRYKNNTCLSCCY